MCVFCFAWEMNLLCVFRCAKCGDIINKTITTSAAAKHRCGAWWCTNCRQFHERAGEPFPCYIRKLGEPDKDAASSSSSADDDDDDSRSESGAESSAAAGSHGRRGAEKRQQQQKKPPSFIIYDFECYQTDEMNLGVFNHQVNSVTAHKFCDLCGPDWTPETRCRQCKEAFREFDSDPSTALKDFVDWLFEPHNKGVIALAHNAGTCLFVVVGVVVVLIYKTVQIVFTHTHTVTNQVLLLYRKLRRPFYPALSTAEWDTARTGVTGDADSGA